MGFNVVQLAERIQTEADAYRFMESLRWGEGVQPTCLHCASDDTTLITPKNGVSRTTRRGKESQRRVWRCRECRKQFSVLTGTVFHGTKVSIRKWLFVIFEMCASKNGISAREVERKYGVCARTAWFMMHRLREAMTRDPVVPMFRGTVYADETFIGGKERNRHLRDRYQGPTDGTPQRIVPGTREPQQANNYFRKTAVLTLIDADTGESRSAVVPDVTGATLRKAIASQVDMANTVLHTDEARAYMSFASELAGHETVNHNQDEYVRYEGDRMISSNAAENFFSQLKRSIDGTHHHVSREHLPRYLAEFDYRFSTRKESDTERMVRLMGQVGGKRLTYKRVSA